MIWQNSDIGRDYVRSPRDRDGRRRAVACRQPIILICRTRRVPDPAGPAARLESGVAAFAAFGLSGLTLGASLAGLSRLGLALMLPGHLFGATGAGRSKLFAFVSALIQPPTPSPVSSSFPAICGRRATIALGGRRPPSAADCGGDRRAPRTSSSQLEAPPPAVIENPLEHNRFSAFAPAIAVGATLAALGL